MKTTEEIAEYFNSTEKWDDEIDKVKWFNEEEIRKIIKDYENPYSKDIFVWDNKEELDFNRGRFNEFTHKIVENVREDILNVLFGDE